MVSARQRRINERNRSNLKMLGGAFKAIGTGLGAEIKAAFTSKQFWEQQGQSIQQMGTAGYWKQMGTGKYWENAGKNAIMYNQFAALGGMESNDPAKRQAAMSAMAGLFVAGGMMAVAGGVAGAVSKAVGTEAGGLAGEGLARGTGEGIATRGAGESITSRSETISMRSETTRNIHPRDASEKDVKAGVAKWNKDVKQYDRNYTQFQKRSWFRRPRQDMRDKYYVDRQASRNEALHGERMGAEEDTDWGKLTRSQVYRTWRLQEVMQESAEHLEERDVMVHFETVDRNDFFIRLKSWADEAPDFPAGEILK